MATTKSAKSRSRAAQFSKTKMCKFEILGMCTKGTACPFAHSAVEINPLPDLSRTKLCKLLLQTGECNKPGCSYAHSKDELRVGGVYKTKICRFFSESGHCALGTRCSFAHSDCEVRPSGVPLPASPPVQPETLQHTGLLGTTSSSRAVPATAAAVGATGLGVEKNLVHTHRELQQPQTPQQLIQSLPQQLSQQQLLHGLSPPMQLPQPPTPQPPPSPPQQTQRAQQAPSTLQQEPSRQQQRKNKQKGQLRQSVAAMEPPMQLTPPPAAPALQPIQSSAASAVPPPPMEIAPRPYIPSVGLDVFSALQAAYPVPRGLLQQQSDLISRLGPRLEDKELLNNPAYVAIEENTAHIVLGSLVIDQQDNVLKIRSTNPSKIPSPSLRPMRPVRTSETTLCSLSDVQL